MTTDVELTDAQKEALEAKIAYAAALTRATASKKGCAEKISAFLAHPALITLLGSGLLSLLVWHYQQQALAAQQQAEHSQQIREKRLAIASASIADLDRSGMILINLQILKRSMESGKFPHNLSRDEAFSVYKSLIATYMAQPHRFTTVAQLHSWYSCDAGVLKRVSTVDHIYETFEALSPKDITDQQLNDFQAQSEKGLGDLSNAMVVSLEPKGKCY